MKISKLFHWLYAILMLLPFAFFVPSVLYYAFNDNATMQSVEVPKTKTIAVDFNQNIETLDDFIPIQYSKNIEEQGVDLVVNLTSSSNLQCYKEYVLDNTHIYYLRFNFMSEVGGIFYARLGLLGSTPSVDSEPFIPTSVGVRKYADFNGINEVNFYSILSENNFSNGDVIHLYSCELFDLTKMFGAGNEPTIIEFNQMFPNGYYPYTESELMQITYDTGETEQLVQNTDIINYAWESIWNLPLFSWSKVSFVAVPFTYITGLFGLAPSNSFNYVFTYFASMSIIWLVFDVILYVPLLVHRWLDKGIVE